MQCIIRIIALLLTAIVSAQDHAADFRTEVRQYALAHEAAIVGELDAWCAAPALFPHQPSKERRFLPGLKAGVSTPNI